MVSQPNVATPHTSSEKSELTLSRYLGVFRYTTRAIELVWQTSQRLTLVLGALTVVAGLLPASIAWVGKQIIDTVLVAIETEATTDAHAALVFVAIEAGLIVALAAAQRGLGVCQSLLRAQLGHRVNVMILEKALTLELAQFEDSEFYDKMTQARRQASARPLALVQKSFGLAQNGIALLTYGALLLQFSPLAVLVLIAAAIPPFVAETKFAGEAFRLFKWRSPETRKQMYLEAIVAREDYAKEVQLMELGPLFVQRYRDIFTTVYDEDRDLTLRRGVWGFLLGLISTAALYGAYGWIVLATAAKQITLGQMTMYLLVFKQGQSAFSAILQAIGGMYEDNLYVSNLYEFLEQKASHLSGDATSGPTPGDGIRFDNVSFTYPGAERPALSDVTMHLYGGRKLALVGHNGSGKTTLIKLLTRLYEPSGGRILLDGRPLHEWDHGTLRRRIGVIFQDFVKYQLTAGENVGVGDVTHFDDEARQRTAAEKGMAHPFLDALPDSYATQLGRWFERGQELSLGQWQKVALSRAFMREGADILVLDEPTAAMDAEAEAQIFERVRALTDDQIAILISHRFSTVRMADEIVVLDEGRVAEQGTHEDLIALGGRYARLFDLQAEGYR